MIFEKKTPLNSWTKRPMRPHWLIRVEHKSTKDGYYTIGKIRWYRDRTTNTWHLKASLNGDEHLNIHDMRQVLWFMEANEEGIDNE